MEKVNISSKLFNVTPGTFVKILVSEEDEIEIEKNGSQDSEQIIYTGYCTAFKGQQDCFEDYIILKDAVDISHNERIPRPLIINIPEIIQIEIINIPETEGVNGLSTEDDDVDAEEVTLETVVIEEVQQLELLINAMEELDILACSFEGKSIGRFGVVTWIILVVKDTLLPLNINSLSKKLGDEVLWRKLGAKIFSNPKLVKVFYDSRGPADYLLHQHGIGLNNVFDSQITDLYIQKTLTGMTSSTYRSLSECLEHYCNSVTLSNIKILQEYEKNLIEYSSAWVTAENLPSASILKTSAVKVKHLINLRKSLIRKIMAKYESTVKNQLDYYLENPTGDFAI